MCHPKNMTVNTVTKQTESFKRERQKFKEEVSKHDWKKFWVIAILKTVHKKKGLEPSVHPFYSIQRLQYLDEMSYKLERGLDKVKFNDIYDEWTKILKERGVSSSLESRRHGVCQKHNIRRQCKQNVIGGNTVIPNRRIGIFIRMYGVHASRCRHHF